MLSNTDLGFFSCDRGVIFNNVFKYVAVCKDAKDQLTTGKSGISQIRRPWKFWTGPHGVSSSSWCRQAGMAHPAVCSGTRPETLGKSAGSGKRGLGLLVLLSLVLELYTSI